MIFFTVLFIILGSLLFIFLRPKSINNKTYAHISNHNSNDFTIKEMYSEVNNND